MGTFMLLYFWELLARSKKKKLREKKGGEKKIEENGLDHQSLGYGPSTLPLRHSAYHINF